LVSGLMVAEREALSPAMANGSCRMHGGPSPGAPKGVINTPTSRDHALFHRALLLVVSLVWMAVLIGGAVLVIFD
jgi:hypothetical protein